MYISSKKFTEEGRSRFGSAIFIDDIEEEQVDSLNGFQYDRGVLLAVLLLALSHVVAANILSILIILPIFLTIYYYAVKKVKLTYTKHRILIESEYLYHSFVKIISNVLVIIGGVILFQYLFQDPSAVIEKRLEYSAGLFNIFGLYDHRYFAYRAVVRRYFGLIYHLDILLSLLVIFWFIYQYKVIQFQFTEVNLNHITEQLTRVTAVDSVFAIFGFIAFYALTQFLFFDQFSFIYLFGLLLVYQLIPREGKIAFSIIGPSNRVLEENVILSKSQISNISRITATTFGWPAQKSQNGDEYPANIIPTEVVNTFDTGLRAYSRKAYRQANYLGVIISTIINIIVLTILLWYAGIRQLEDYRTVFFLFTLLLGSSILIFIGVEVFNEFRRYNQSNEQLLIGEGFIARSISDSLWILKGSGLEGTTIQRGKQGRLIRYDKTRGLVIAWERFTLLFVLGGFILIIGIWSSLGGINLSAIPYLFAELLDFGFEFIERKAEAELEFFIITGYITWILLVILYPRYYARSRPTLFLDMHHSTVEPILLRDFMEHQAASLQFTKSLIKSSERSKRQMIPRPGSFLLDMNVSGMVAEGKTLRFYLGENHRIKELQLPLRPTRLYRNVIVSGLRGYPSVNLIVELLNDNHEVIYTNTTELTILYGKRVQTDLDLGIFGSVMVELVIMKQKS